MAWTVFFFMFLAWGEKGAVPGSVMKNTSEVVNLDCLRKFASQVQWKTADFEIRAANGRLALDEDYRKAVLQTMMLLSRISEDKSLLRAPILVEQHRGGRGGKCFNFSPGGRRIQLVSGCTKTRDGPYEYAAKHFVHELGHVIGQQNNNYAAYFRKVVKPCHLSSYGMNNTNRVKRNEEFADVFRAVVFDLDKVRAAGGSCVAAADYFRDLLKLKSQGCK
jgi:hypothetical protein